MCVRELHVYGFVYLTDLIGPPLGSHGDEGVVLLLQELAGLQDISDGSSKNSHEIASLSLSLAKIVTK